MIRKKFEPPNYRCLAKDLNGNDYDWLTRATNEDELRRRVEIRQWVVKEIIPFDFDDWIGKAKKKTAKLGKTLAKDREFDNSVWTKLKIHLFELFHGKCAYCEAKVQHVSSGDVEHYRPKAKVTDEPTHPGYWWLAYDHTNYLPCCEGCNRARAKMNHFPILGKRAYSQAEVGGEDPLLLNPYHHYPLEHLKFIPPCEIYFGTVEGTTEYGKESVRRYNLNRFELVEDRRAAQEQVVTQALFNFVNSPAKFAAIVRGIAEGEEEYSASSSAAVAHCLSELQERLGLSMAALMPGYDRPRSSS